MNTRAITRDYLVRIFQRYKSPNVAQPGNQFKLKSVVYVEYNIEIHNKKISIFITHHCLSNTL